MLRLKQVLIFIQILFITACASSKVYTPPDTVEELRSQYMQFNRLSAITHKVFVSNISVCSKIRADYGFTQMSVDKTKDGADLWIKAFNLKEQPTVTYVIPQGAADKAGLRAGDAIISVNSSRWSEATSQGAFTTLLSEARKSPHLRLGILRGDKEQTVNLIADKACDYSFTLSVTDKHNAMALQTNIVIDLGVARLLARDGELAFIVSHELAHILLGHTQPEQQNALDDDKLRGLMEKEADKLGMHLMLRAGYDPKDAETALQRIDLIDSGPVTRFFNYHGPYMNTDERIQYLRKVVNQ